MKKIIIMLLVLAVFIFPLCQAKIATSYKHTNDYYAVTFDGEGDAMVSANLLIQNTMENSSIQILTLEIPKQIVLYDATQEYNGQQIRIKHDALLEKQFEHSTILQIVLPNETKAGEMSSVILTYKIPEYARKKLLGFRFDFETIVDKNADLVENVRVAVNVLPELYLKGSGSEIEYQPDFSLMRMQSDIVAEAASADMVSYVQKVKSSEGYVKTASYLDSGETFHVVGRFTQSKLVAHFFTIISFVIVLGLIIFGFIKLYSRIRKFKITSRLQGPVLGSTIAVMLVILAFLSKYLLDHFNHTFEVLAIIIFILVVVLSLTLFFGAPIYIGVKNKSFLMGVITFVFMVFTLIVILSVLTILNRNLFFTF